ncbi:hypothetical protein CL656_07075 [bacterium]|nr:hypothetical protein [bacterium]
MCKINSLINLYYILNNNFNNNDFKKLISIVNLYDGSDWKYFSIINKNKNYNKVFIPLISNNIEMYIITWNKHIISKIHNHSKNGCILKLLKGELYENHYDHSLNLLSHNKINKNDTTYIDNKLGYHSIISKNELSVSLHIYSPPKHKTIYFN